jgi:anti-sigma B factor antagonist
VALPGFALLCRRADGEVVIEVRGELDPNTAPVLRGGLAHLIDEQDDLSVVIDLRDLEFIDSTGLAALAHARQRLRAQGGGITLAHPRSGIQKVLEISGLGTVLPVRGSEDPPPAG